MCRVNRGMDVVWFRKSRKQDATFSLSVVSTMTSKKRFFVQTRQLSKEMSAYFYRSANLTAFRFPGGERIGDKNKCRVQIVADGTVVRRFIVKKTCSPWSSVLVDKTLNSNWRHVLRTLHFFIFRFQTGNACDSMLCCWANLSTKWDSYQH